MLLSCTFVSYFCGFSFSFLGSLIHINLDSPSRLSNLVEYIHTECLRWSLSQQEAHSPSCFEESYKSEFPNKNTIPIDAAGGSFPKSPALHDPSPPEILSNPTYINHFLILLLLELSDARQCYYCSLTGASIACSGCKRKTKLRNHQEPFFHLPCLLQGIADCYNWQQQRSERPSFNFSGWKINLLNRDLLCHNCQQSETQLDSGGLKKPSSVHATDGDERDVGKGSSFGNLLEKTSGTSISDMKLWLNMQQKTSEGFEDTDGRWGGIPLLLMAHLGNRTVIQRPWISQLASMDQIPQPPSFKLAHVTRHHVRVEITI